MDAAGLPQDRPARGSLADLRLRLESLPSGHPSSPYDDQGARKAALQQLRQLELPLADEERESESAARSSRMSAAVGSHNGAGAPPLPASRPLTSSGGTAPDWTTSRNGVVPPSVPPARDEPPGGNGTSSYEIMTGDAEPARRHGTAPRDTAPATRDLPGRNGAGWQHSAPPGDELVTRNAGPESPSTVSDGWRDPDGATVGQNGHSGGFARISEPGVPPPSGLADSGVPDHDPAGQVLPGHAILDHDISDHAILDHASPDGDPDRALAEHPGLTREQEEIADQALGRYRAADGRNVFGGYGESGLTPAIRRVEAHLPHGRLAPDTDQYTLKSPERYKEKLARLIARNPDVPARDLAAEIYDAARYTFVFEPQDYTDGTWLVHRRLKAHGFELEARRNRWESPEYKGVRTRWRDPAHDLAFEVQFHTPASWDVVQRTHDAYLRIINSDTPAAERAQLRSRQVAAAAATRPPPRCAEIGDFRADVR